MLDISPGCPTIPKTVMLGLSVFLFCFAITYAQNWTDYTNGADCFFWPNAGAPFDDLKGYILNTECTTIHVIPCNTTCDIAQNACNSYADECESTDQLIVTDHPYVISRPDLTIQSASTTKKAAFVMFSQQNSYYAEEVTSCGNAFIVNGRNVNFKDIEFKVDPACAQLNLPLHGTTPLVYNEGGTVALTRVSLNPQDTTPTLALFSNIEGLNLTTQEISSPGSEYTFFLLDVSGTFFLDTGSTMFLNGTASGTNTDNVFNISSYIPSPSEFGCSPETVTVKTNCDSIAKTNHILEIVVGVISGLLGALGLAYTWKSFHHKHVNLD